MSGKPRGAGDAGSLLVSVVIPTYERPTLLARCLAAVGRQTLDPASYEIIIADDANCGETRAVVERTRLTQCEAGGPIIRYVTVAPEHGPAAARNAGWRAAVAPVIAFTDDDCVPDPDWLKAGLAAMNEGVAGVSGRVVAPCAARPTDYERNAALLAHAEFVTANCFYRRDALQSVGGFDERFLLAWREDSDVMFTLLERGAALVRADAAIVTHPIRPAPWGVSLQQQKRSLYNALLYRKHPALYRSRIQRRPPWRYYATCGSLVVALCGCLTRRPQLARLAAAVWLGHLARFCATRLRGASRRPSHVAEMVITSALIPPLAVYWRIRGALRFRVWFL